jgi:pimeloyl-ACP methyl ester carboxylesterase
MGVGHSMGGNNLVNVGLIHPRLFTSLILIDPVIARMTSAKGNVFLAQSSAVRREIWPSRKAAKESFQRSKFYQAWDPRVLDLWVQYGLRDLPTKLYPKPQPAQIPAGAATTEPTLTPEPAEDKQVTLTTTKHQEVFTFLRPNLSPDPKVLAGLDQEEIERLRDLTHHDFPNDWEATAKVYRPEPIITFTNLPHLRPSVYYMFGELSPISAPALRADKMGATGTGSGGSGGAPKGRVEEVVVKNVGHLIPMEKVGETGEAAVDWIGREMQRWRKDEELLARLWNHSEEIERYTLGKGFMEIMGGDLGGGKPGRKPPPKTAKL